MVTAKTTKSIPSHAARIEARRPMAELAQAMKGRSRSDTFTRQELDDLIKLVAARLGIIQNK